MLQIKSQHMIINCFWPYIRTCLCGCAPEQGCVTNKPAGTNCRTGAVPLNDVTPNRHFTVEGRIIMIGGMISDRGRSCCSRNSDSLSSCYFYCYFKGPLGRLCCHSEKHCRVHKKTLIVLVLFYLLQFSLKNKLKSNKYLRTEVIYVCLCIYMAYFHTKSNHVFFL